jgi:hypothetical protein
VNFQAGMQQPGILQPAEPDSLSIGHRRFTEVYESYRRYSYRPTGTAGTALLAN